MSCGTLNLCELTNLVKNNCHNKTKKEKTKLAFYNQKKLREILIFNNYREIRITNIFYHCKIACVL